MANIVVRDLTFCHEGSVDALFSHAGFTLDTDWKLGFVGRNGRGKTTFLRLLLGEFPYQGSIAAPVRFAYFPFDVPKEQSAWPALRVARAAIAPFDEWEARMRETAPDAMDAYAEAYERYLAHDGFSIDEMIVKEAGKLGVRAEALGRPFGVLSPGERAKVMLAALFLRKNNFLLIDEPTDHLDAQGRALMARYLAGKRGFILVSHDRALLDGVVDHVLSINRSTIEVQQGNFSVWWENKRRKDQHELEQDDQLRREIRRLSQTAREKSDWSSEVEKTKIGAHAGDRGFIGHKAAKMMRRAKAIEERSRRAVGEKAKLLQDIETADPVKLLPLVYHKERLIEVRDLSVAYGEKPVFEGLTFELLRGERAALTGSNGCGKSSVLKLLLGRDVPYSGEARAGGGLIISYAPQSAEGLAGPLGEYLAARALDETLVKSLLRKLDFSRAQFDLPLQRYSEGQKKKLLLAASLSMRAHLYIWDEPLNYIDVFSRVQIEELLLRFEPTLLFVEHDAAFCDHVATKTIRLRHEQRHRST